MEAEALAGLGEIYKDMGLDQRASQRATEALAKVNPIIMNRQKLLNILTASALGLGALAPLEQDHRDQEDADHHMQHDQHDPPARLTPLYHLQVPALRI